MQAHSAKATTSNQQEQEPKQATKQQTKQRLEIVRPAQSRSLFVFFAFNMHLFYVAVVWWRGGRCAPPNPPPHHEICTSSPTPAPATKSHFKVNPLRQNTFSTNQPSPRGGGWEPSPPALSGGGGGGGGPPPGRLGGGGSPPPTICGGQNWRNYQRSSSGDIIFLMSISMFS